MILDDQIWIIKRYPTLQYDWPHREARFCAWIYNFSFLSIFGSVKHAILRWLALHVQNIVDQGGYSNRFNRTRIRPRKQYVLKDSMVDIGLTDMKNGKVI